MTTLLLLPMSVCPRGVDACARGELTLQTPAVSHQSIHPSVWNGLAFVDGEQRLWCIVRIRICQKRSRGLLCYAGGAT